MITLVTIFHNLRPAQRLNAEAIFAAARWTHPGVEILPIDTTDCNIGYGGALNRAVRQAHGDVLVYFSSNRARMLDDRWLERIIAPLADPNCGMAGSVRRCQFDRIARRPCDIWEPQIHVQGGIFAARTEVLRENPWSPYFPQVFSDVYQSWNLMKSGYYLQDVPEIQSEERGRARSGMMVCDYSPDALLDEEFDARCRRTSPINEHGRTLRDLAARANRVVEFGVEHGDSTIFLLVARPRRMRSYDIDPAVSAEGLLPFVPAGTDFRFEHADSRQVRIDVADLLLIDTDHNYAQLSAELRQHCRQVTRRIALHDTATYPGCLQAVQDFIREDRNWRILQHYENNNGLTILERQAGHPCPAPCPAPG